MCITENELRMCKDPGTRELKAEFTLRVSKHMSIPYEYWRREASTYRRIGMEWRVKEPSFPNSV